MRIAYNFRSRQDDNKIIDNNIFSVPLGLIGSVHEGSVWHWKGKCATSHLHCHQSNLE